MKAILKDNGDLIVPMRAEADGIIGDGVATFHPDDEGYEAMLKEWEGFIESSPKEK